MNSKPRPSVALLDLNGHHGTRPHSPPVIVGALQTLQRPYPRDLYNIPDSKTFSIIIRDERNEMDAHFLAQSRWGSHFAFAYWFWQVREQLPMQPDQDSVTSCFGLLEAPISLVVSLTLNWYCPSQWW